MQAALHRAQGDAEHRSRFIAGELLEVPEQAEGRVGVGLAIVGMAVVGNLPGGRALSPAGRALAHADEAVGPAVHLGGDAAQAGANILDDAGRVGERTRVPASGPRATAAQRRQVNEIGQRRGCETCGTREPGTRSGNWIPNHTPPTAVRMPGEAQQLGPHCATCSARQGNFIRRLLEQLKEKLR